ncbi:tripartite tricarboxylate transporter substrate binding protein [soil metagenome]
MKPIAAALALLCTLLIASPASAAYPDRPIRMVVTFPAGSNSDVMARILSDAMSKDLGQPIIIDNRGGAQGIIGMQAATTAAPDGYTIVVIGVTTGASNPSMFRKLPYDPMKDLTIIGMVADSPLVLVSSPALPVASANELFALARKQPGKLSYGYGSGSAQVACAKLVSMVDAQVLSVPYKGSPQAMTDLIGGQIDFTLIDVSLAMPQAKSGKVKALAVTTKERFPLMPDTPTLDEIGVKGYDLSVWFALGAPAGLPAPIVDRLSTSLKTALANPELTKRFSEQAITPKYSTPDQARSFMQKEIIEWGKMIKAAGVEPLD